MKVKITEDMFTSSIFEIEIKEDSLFLCSSDGKEISIPFEEIKHFNIEGRSGCLKSFLLETKEREIEGFFNSDEEASKFLTQLRKRGPFYIDVRLDPVNKLCN